MFGNLFGKKSVAQSYDIVEVSKDTWTVHLNGEQTSILASKGLGDVRELTFTRGVECWRVEYSFQLPDGKWQNISSGGIAFADETLEQVLEQFFSC